MGTAEGKITTLEEGLVAINAKNGEQDNAIEGLGNDVDDVNVKVDELARYKEEVIEIFFGNGSDEVVEVPITGKVFEDVRAANIDIFVQTGSGYRPGLFLPYELIMVNDVPTFRASAVPALAMDEGKAVIKARIEVPQA